MIDPPDPRSRTQLLHVEDHGYRKSLSSRQLHMIAFGGAIGSGLFLGSGKQLEHTGPLLFAAYAVCGVVVFFVLRALGELVLYRPSSGSFVSYAREFYGEKAAFVAGWMYFLNWAMVAIVDTTAVARYLHYWPEFQAVPQWILALTALLVALGMNLTTVRWFGEMEFWTALLKVMVLFAFLAFGVIFLLRGFHIGSDTGGLHVLSQAGGPLPSGMLPLLIAVNGAVFAYASVEMLGTAAGETANAEKVVPRAINVVIIRLSLCYIGSLALLALLLPWTSYRAGTSPFVTFFSQLGFSGADTAVNIVVLTAALSSLSAGLYSTGRVLRSLALSGSAPAFAGKLSSRGVPANGIVLTCFVALCGVGLNAWVPDRAFEIGLSVASLGIITSWMTIVACQLRLWRLCQQDVVERPRFRMIGAPYSGIATLVFLATVPVMMAFDYPDGTAAMALLTVIIPALVIGWFAARRRVMTIAIRRSGYFGDLDDTITLPRLDQELIVLDGEVMDDDDVIDVEVIESHLIDEPVGYPEPPPPPTVPIPEPTPEPPLIAHHPLPDARETPTPPLTTPWTKLGSGSPGPPGR